MSPDEELTAKFAHLHADAVAALKSYQPGDPAQESLRADYLGFLARHPTGVAKAGPPAHLTASCLVLNTDGSHVLLTLHRKAQEWFQFGGHLESQDASLHAAATREAREESGIDLITPPNVIVELNRHTLVGTFGRCREHLDIRYAACAPAGAQPVVSEESLEVRWWPVDGLPEGSRRELQPLVLAARRSLGFAASR